MDRTRALNPTSRSALDTGKALLVALSSLAGTGCTGDPSFPELDAPRNVTQGGAQDIGEFRAAIERQQVPASSLLDEVGFFAEHAIDLPPPNCDGAVCAHPMLGVAPRFDGGNWTMVFVGMNTALDPTDLPEKPKHLLLVIENTTAAVGSLALGTGALRAPLLELLDEDDRVTLVDAQLGTTEVQLGLTPEEFRKSVLREPSPNAEYTDLYAALAEARAVALDPALSEYRQRILLFTSGQPTAGATTAETMAELAREIAGHAVGISTFGVGADFQSEMPTSTAEAGAGNSYFIASDEDLELALMAEAATGFVPIARDLQIEVRAETGYRIGATYGARRAETTDTGALLTSPVLFMGAREGSDSMTAGRRGGGGGWFVQLIAEAPPGETEETEAPVASVRVEFEDALSGERTIQETLLSSPHGVGNNPPPDAPYFSDEPRAKPFMMLNMLMALRGSVEYYEQGACPEALGMRDMMEMSYVLWQQRYQDADIDDDFRLLDELTDVIGQSCSASRETLWPVEAGVSCFFF